MAIYKGVPTEARNSTETCFQVQCFVPDGKINFKLLRLEFVLLFSFDMIIMFIAYKDNKIYYDSKVCQFSWVG